MSAAEPIRWGPIRWGIAGPGRIAEAVARDFDHVDDARIVAVGSRSAERADAFAQRHGIAAEHAHGSYAALLADPGVDAVYISTPHPQHHAIAVAALDAGKAVLVEKAFTATLAGARDVFATAQATGGFAMEAMWTRFLPAIVRMRHLLADGAIGEPLSVQADLGVRRAEEPAHRLFDPALGGGAMLDLGVYVVSFAQMVLGTPTRVTAQGRIGATGVETDAAILLEFDGGTSATLSTSLRSPMPGQARVFGTDGWIDVLPRFHHPHQLVLHRADNEPETITAPPAGVGYEGEFLEVGECLRAGRQQSETMPWADTLAVQAVLDDVLHQLGIELAEDPAVL